MGGGNVQAQIQDLQFEFHDVFAGQGAGQGQQNQQSNLLGLAKLPSIFDDKNIEKLSPRNMMNFDEDEDKHMKCLICMKIVMAPKECSNCRTIFCADCIDGWAKNNTRCPIKCEAAVYVEMHRILKGQLMQKRFTCPMEGCKQEVESDKEEGYAYMEAIEHQKNCLYRRRFCQHGCGQKFLGIDKEEHEKKCPEVLETCDKCQCEYKINLVSEANPHNCIDAMKREVKKYDDDLSQIKFQYGINYDVMNNKCKNSHPLKVHYGIVRSYNGTPRCNECRESFLDDHEFFYRCDECSYDLCRLCALTKSDPPVLGQKLKTSEHACVLERMAPNHDGQWNCDVSHKENGAGIRCQSAIPDYGKTKQIQGYRCRQCDFDLCLKCALRYRVRE